jgi:hypothetical protein
MEEICPLFDRKKSPREESDQHEAVITEDQSMHYTQIKTIILYRYLHDSCLHITYISNSIQL